MKFVFLAMTLHACMYILHAQPMSDKALKNAMTMTANVGTDKEAWPLQTAAREAGTDIWHKAFVEEAPFYKEGEKRKDVVYVEDYGAIANDNRPDDAAFAAATAAATASGYRIIELGYGTYNLTYWNATKDMGNFSRIIIQGQGRGDGGALNEKYTHIKCANKTGPCITANAFRLAEIRDFVVEGNNYSKAVAMSQKSEVSTWRPENWVEAGNSIDRYEHQSGLALDYGQQQAPWAAQGIFERLKIAGFVVGFSISPSAGNLQGDTYWFRDIKMEGNVYGFSIGQDQCRSITFENVWQNQGYCAYVNNRFGKGNGSAFNVSGGQYTSLFKLFECTNAYRGQMHIDGIFAEAIGILGAINGLGVNTNGVAFTSCEIGLDDDGYHQPRQGVWVTPFTVLTVGGNAVFTACNIHSKKKTLGFGGGQYIFNGTTFTETLPVFPNDWASVSINGRPLFDNQRQITDQTNITPEAKRYVRHGTSRIRLMGLATAPYAQTVLAKSMIPYWGPGIMQKLPDTDAMQFEWPINSSETKLFRAGDFLDCQAKAKMIAGMDTDFGQAAIPGLEVMQVKSGSLLLRRVAPEIRVESSFSIGRVYTEPYLWATVSPIEAEADGTTVAVKNGSLLSPGDYVSSGGQLARVVSINGNTVTFNETVKKGRLLGVSW